MPPAWLPPLLLFADFSADWFAFNDAAYDIFIRDVKDRELLYEGRKIIWDARLSKGKDEGFWHITTVIDAANNERIPDIRRTEKIAWLRPVIENATNPLISIWKQVHPKGKSNEIRVYIWLESLEYLVVLAERKDHYFLVTAFATDGERTKKKLRKEREEHIRNSGGSP